MINSIKTSAKKTIEAILKYSMSNERISNLIEKSIFEHHQDDKEKSRINIKGYLPAKDTLTKAKYHDLSVQEYLEEIWNQKGNAENVIKNMKSFGVFDEPIKTICEIGPGAGLYLNKVMSLCCPCRYEIYEPAKDWEEWLYSKYDVIPKLSDGISLLETKSLSVDLVQAHGIFVYIPFITITGYFKEINRITKSGGYAVFDLMTESCFTEECIERWLVSDDRYPVFVSREYVNNYFSKHSFQYIGGFHTPFGQGYSEYFVYRKNHM